MTIEERMIDMADTQKSIPLYQSIFDIYAQHIRDGSLLPGQSIPSEAQLAQLHGVSNITARRVLNELKRQGLVVRQRGRGSFVADPKLCSAASTEDMHRVTLIFPMDNQFTKAAELIATLFTLLQKHGHYLSVQFSNDSEQNEARLLEQAIAEKVDGILFYPVSSWSNTELVLKIKAKGIPMVLIDRAHAVGGFPTVVHDNVKGGRLLTHYLLSKGYDSIVFVSNHELSHATSIRDRYQGYVSAMLEAGKTIDDVRSIFIPDDASQEEYANLIQMLQQGAGPMALMCMSDPVAISLMQVMADNDLRVPEDVAMTGFDNLMLSMHTTPPLTTMHQDFAMLAKASGETLLKEMKRQRDPSAPLIQYIPVSLVERQTTKA